MSIGEEKGGQQRLRAAENLLADARAYAAEYFKTISKGAFKEGNRSNVAVVLSTKLDV